MKLKEAFKQQMSQLLQDEWTDFEAALHESSTRGIRIHRFPPTHIPSFLQEHLGDAIPWAKAGYYVSDDTVLPKTVYHEIGALYLQEPSAMAAAIALQPRPSERILDLCAAPGSKTTFIGRLMDKSCQLIANEIHKGRVSILAENIERLGVEAAVINNAPEDLAAIWQSQFDAILVDAPCSGEGMFRKNDSAIAEWTADSPTLCAERQRTILNAAVEMLRPGGRIIYSTCTFNPIENEQIVAWMEDVHNFVVQPISNLPGWSSGRPEWADGRESLLHTRRSWPHLTKGEGHFVACLVKPDYSTNNHPIRAIDVKSTVPPEWRAFVDEHFDASNPDKERLLQTITHRDVIFHHGLQGLPTKGVRILRSGVPFAQMEKGRITPHQSLAFAMEVKTFRPQYDVDEGDAIRYLKGESLGNEASLRGFLCVTHEGLALGFAKGVPGRLNNLYPKGKRKHHFVTLQT